MPVTGWVTPGVIASPAQIWRAGRSRRARRADRPWRGQQLVPGQVDERSGLTSQASCADGDVRPEPSVPRPLLVAAAPHGKYTHGESGAQHHRVAPLPAVALAVGRRRSPPAAAGMRFAERYRLLLLAALAAVALSAVAPWIDARLRAPDEPLHVAVTYRHPLGDIQYFPLIDRYALDVLVLSTTGPERPFAPPASTWAMVFDHAAFRVYTRAGGTRR